MRIAFTFAALTIALSATSAFAQDDNQNAYRRIVTGSDFCVGGRGFAAEITPEEKALWVLVRANDEKRLVALTWEKSLVAQLYGMVGLRYLSYPEYKNVAASLAQSQAEVPMFVGCVRERKKIAEVSQHIAKGSYDVLLKNDMERQKK